MLEKLLDQRFYRKFYFQDSFYAQICDVNPLTMDQFDRSVEQVKEVIKNPVFKTAKHIIGSGCGDSNLVAFTVKEAFAHYLPDVEYEAVEAVELSRHYDYEEDGKDTLGLFVSVSGSIYRTVEAMKQCQKHGITCVAITDNPTSITAEGADILYWTNSPKGDNNAGLRTIYCNIISTIILAAAMAELRTGKSFIPELREQVQAYHDKFFAEFEKIDQFTFETAIDWMCTDKKYFEIVADGPCYWSGRIIHAKMVELSGDAVTTIDSENYWHVNQFIPGGKDIANIVLLNTNDANVDRMVESIGTMLEGERDVCLFCDKSPAELGITADIKYCYVPVPPKEFNFLNCIYGFLPGSMMGGFRHTTIGEPMFRGGMIPYIFSASYMAPMDVVDIDNAKK